MVPTSTPRMVFELDRVDDGFAVFHVGSGSYHFRLADRLVSMATDVAMFKTLRLPLTYV